MGFRYRKGMKVSYDRQGYLYFYSKLYRQMGKEERGRIDRVVRKAGGQYWKALLDFVTTNKSATEIEMGYYISRATLYRAQQRYYEMLDRELDLKE